MMRDLLDITECIVTVPDVEIHSTAQVITGLILIGFVIAGTAALFHGRRYYRRRPLNHPEVDGPLVRRPWQGIDVLLIMLFYIVTHVGAYRLYSLVEPVVDDPESSMAVQLSLAAALQLGGLAFILWLAIRHRGGWRKAFGRERGRPLSPLWLAAVIYLAIWPVQLVATPLYHGLLRMLKISVDMQESLIILTTTDSPIVLAALLFMALIVAPVAEELFFRGILLPVFRRRLGIWPAVILSSLVFALIHFHIPSFTGLFIVAIACSLAALWGKSVVPAIWLHALFNTVNTLLVLTWGIDGS